MLCSNNSLAIACASGGFKAIFVHGVLSAFESVNIQASAYAAASASVIPAAWAAIGKAQKSGVDYWLEGLKIYHQTNSMSLVCRGGVDYFGDRGGEQIFNLDRPHFYVVTSKVVTAEAAAQTQGDRAKRLGRKLLIAAAKGDRTWTDKHLELNLFGISGKKKIAIAPDNFAEVVYASTRMLHAWDIPAWIDGQPYVDASYTCVCPAIEMAEREYQVVIAIATEPGDLYRDWFRQEVIPKQIRQTTIHQIKPDLNLKQLGVDFFHATPEGLATVYQHGWNKGREFFERSPKFIEESNRVTK